MLPCKPRLFRCAVFAAWLQLAASRYARAEDSAAYKFQSWQEDAGRIRVDTHSARLEKTLPAEIKLQLSGVLDAIAGATPTGEPAATPDGQVPLTRIEDRRKAWQADLSRQFSPVNVALGYANSRESDYVSNGWSVNTLTDFNRKNTTVLAGLAGTDDDVKVFFQRDRMKKRGLDAIVGVTQLIDPQTSLTVNLTRGRATGYLSDPYKLILKHTEIAPGVFLPLTFGENRPERREKWVVFASINHAFEPVDGAVDASYRFYRDSYHITSHTLEVAWFQKFFGGRLILRPGVRFYEQTAADFYRLTLDGTPIVPGARPNSRGPFYSADYRLSKLRTISSGLKVVWTVLPGRLSVDASYERYTMRGRDGVTAHSAYPDANVFTGGATLAW